MTTKKNADAILLTGASGFLAGELIKPLLNLYTESTLYLLLRADSADQLAKRRDFIIERCSIDSVSAQRIIAIAGNIEQTDLGLATDYDKWAATINEIYHSAATTRFDLNLVQARESNLNGTKNILQFARRAQDLGRFTRLHHVSTAYVSGNRTGVIKEDELNCGQDFFNTYEQSKFETEIMLAEARTQLPITIYRPSIIVGDSRTGRTAHFHVIYEPMKWVYQGQLSFLPCRPEVKLDIVPVDYVCTAMIAIGRQDDSVGNTYHITSGPDRSVDLSEMVELCVKAFNDYNNEIGKPPVSKPQIVTPEMLEKFEQKKGERYRTFFDQAWQQMQRHMPYAVSYKIFDDSRTTAALAGSGISCPTLHDYLTVLIRYGLERQFRTYG
ncbi:MAG: SDR family oxidoreductase [Acidobacteriota bacterium]